MEYKWNEEIFLTTGSLFGGSGLGVRTVRLRDKRAGREPNILIFVSDDTGWNDVGFHNPEVETPNIDRMAREGVELYPYVSPSARRPVRAC